MNDLKSTPQVVPAIKRIPFKGARLSRKKIGANKLGIDYKASLPDWIMKKKIYVPTFIT